MTGPVAPKRIAVVGGGVSGLVAAAELRAAGHDVHLFEAGGHPGGHSNTIDVETPDGPLAVDTGFIVFNDRNYPNFERLLFELGVPSQPASMSFSVSDGRGDFEWSTRGLLTRPAHLLDRRFRRMLLDLVRFNRDARVLIGAPADGPSLRRFLAEGSYSDYFIERLLVPQVSAVWSADPEQLWRFPAAFLAEFFENHGVLQLVGRPRWRTIPGGARRYVEALIAPFRSRVHLRSPVRRIVRDAESVSLEVDGELHTFDEVVIATHSDQALRMLGDPTPAERAILGAIPYQRNEAVLHTDAGLMPQAPLGVGELELPPHRAAHRPHDGHLRHEPPAVPRGRPRPARHPQPHRGDRPRARDPRDRLCAPGLHAGGRRRPVALAGDLGPETHPLLRLVLEMGLPRGRRLVGAAGLARARRARAHRRARARPGGGAGDGRGPRARRAA